MAENWKTNAIIKEGSVHVIDSHGIDVLPQVFDTVTDGNGLNQANYRFVTSG